MSQINLFKIQEGKEATFVTFVEGQYETICEKTIGPFHFKLLWQERLEKKDVNWGWAFSIFDKPIKQTNQSPKGIIIIQNANKTYAISFGGAHFHIDMYCDRDFGFDFASRTKVLRTKLTSTIINNSKQNKTISSFKNFDRLEISSGESYTKLKIDIDLTDGDIFENNIIEVGTSLKITLKEDSLSNLTKLINYVEKKLTNPKITHIPICNIVRKQEEIDGLEQRLKDNFLKDGSAVTLSEFDVIGVEEVFLRADSFVLYCEDKSKTIPSFDLDELKMFFIENGITDTNQMLKTKITFLSNGTNQVTKPIRNFIDYLDESTNALLICGKWYRFNDDFYQYLKESLEDIRVAYLSEYDLNDSIINQFLEQKYNEEKDNENYQGKTNEEIRNSIKRRYYREYAFNLMREQDGYKIFDRHIVQVHGEQIELCDLRKDDTIFSVKRGNSSAELSYVVTQSETAINYFINHPQEKRPKNVALWLILSRTNKLELNSNKLNWESLRMLLLKIRIDNWKKRVYLAGMKPEIYINYET